MKRPSFQFYPADWRNNAKLRRCSPAARGVWVDVLCLLHDADEYGVLRWPLKDIIQAAGAAAPLVRELVTKGVLKGADRAADAYVYRPTHAGKQGDPVTLVVPDGGPVWYCSRFVRDEWIRQRRGSATRFDGENQPPKATPAAPPKPTIGGESGDGPTSPSPATHSEANASAGEPAVDKSLTPEERRQLWADAGAWLTENGLTQGDAKAFMNTVAKDHPKTVAATFAEAIKTPAPADAKAFTLGIAKRLDAKPGASLPYPDAEQTAAAEAARRAEFEASRTDPAGQAAVAAAREKLASTRARIESLPTAGVTTQ